MNGEELGKVVAEVQVGDNRKVDEVVLKAWRASIGHLLFEDAVEGVRLHRVERPGVWLEPGHVIANVRIIQRRQERLERVQVAYQRGQIVAPVNEFDRETFDRETQAALVAERIRKGRDPVTGLPLEVIS